MDIMELGAMGELVGGVAVVASLIYVGIQVRQSNRLVRSQIHQEAARASSEIALHTDRETMALVMQGTKDIESLSEIDRSMFVLRLTAAGNYYETLFYARERGEVDDELWQSRLRRMRGTFGMFVSTWATQRVGFGDRFASFVETEVFPYLDRENIFLPEEFRAKG